MKIERLTEDKIRVILNSDELNINDNNVHNIINSQEFFLDILRKAEKEVDFNTDGCKLFIETFSSLDDFFVFTITKYIPDNNKKNATKVKPIAKRKLPNNINKQAICIFEDFDIFCEFCNAIKFLHGIDYDKLTKNTSLYFWKNYYYLIIKNVNTKLKSSYLFYSILSEFAKVISFSSSFESKLLEYGNTIMKKDAINTGIKFFTK